MNTKIDPQETDGSAIEGSVLLEFLIKRCHDVLSSEQPSLPPILEGIGYAVLKGDEKLTAEYKEIFSSSRSPREIIRGCVEIFQRALDRHVGDESREPSQEQDDHQPSANVCRRFMMTAYREGKIMEQQSDYHFCEVFAFLASCGLQCDPEWLAEFETVRDSYKDDPENLVKIGRDILRDALFKRRPPGRVHPLHNSCEEEPPCPRGITT